MADLPINLPPRLAARLTAAMDVEGKIAAALQALGPVADRDVAFVDAEAGPVPNAVRAMGARVVSLPLHHADWAGRPAESCDVVVGSWSAFRGVDPAELAAADRLLRPEGRLLVIHDYGRDDVSHLRGALPEHGDWSRRTGPFLGGGFRIRVLHCFWTFEGLDETRDFLAAAFGDAGSALGADLKRPRLSWKVAVYHRPRLLGSVG